MPRAKARLHSIQPDDVFEKRSLRPIYKAQGQSNKRKLYTYLRSARYFDSPCSAGTHGLSGAREQALLSFPARCIPSLFLLSCREARLPNDRFLTRRCGDDLDLFLLGLLRLAVASLLAFSHGVLLLLFEMVE